MSRRAVARETAAIGAKDEWNRGALTPPAFPFPDIVPQPQFTGLDPASA